MLLISYGGISLSILFLIIATTQSNSNTHSGHLEKLEQVDAKSISNLENQKSILREGDAKSNDNFEIDREYEDPDKTCHFCTNIVYTPGKERFAAIAYGGKSLDLNGSKRMVFFLRGAEGGEKLTFLVGGKKMDGVPGFSNDATANKFPGIKFGLSENLTLSNQWTRFSESLEKMDLSDIAYPFGIILNSENSSNIQSIFLKGVTIDDKESGNKL